MSLNFETNRIQLEPPTSPKWRNPYYLEQLNNMIPLSKKNISILDMYISSVNMTVSWSDGRFTSEDKSEAIAYPYYILTKTYPDKRPKLYNEYSLDMTSLQRFGVFSNYTKEFTDVFAEWIGNRKCLEVIAGAGILSYGLRLAGTDIIPTTLDIHGWVDYIDMRWVDDMEIIDCIEAINKYRDEINVVIMSWPPFMEPLAYNVLMNIRDINKNREEDNQILLVYIGEGWGGATADDNFHESAEDVTDTTFNKVKDAFPTRNQGIHDDIYLMK